MWCLTNIGQLLVLSLVGYSHFTAHTVSHSVASAGCLTPVLCCTKLVNAALKFYSGTKPAGLWPLLKKLDDKELKERKVCESSVGSFSRRLQAMQRFEPDKAPHHQQPQKVCRYNLES
jgi:hypothetical protein